MDGKGRGFLSRLRISVKLAVIYTVLLLASWCMIFFVFYRISYENSIDSARALAEQTKNTICSNVTTLLDNVAYYSRIILSSSDITEGLEAGNVEDQKESLYQFLSLIDSEAHINGIYMWDMNGHACSIDRNQVRTLRTEKITETSWYEEVLQSEGSYCLKLNADRVLTESSAAPAVSMIRVVNNPVDYQPVGILMINIDLDAFDQCSSVDENSVPSVFILDDTGKIITSRSDMTLPKFRDALHSNGENETEIAYKGKKLLLGSSKMDGLNWEVLAGVAIENPLDNSWIGSVFFVMAMVFLAIFCGVGYIVMKKYVAKPLEKLAGSMNRMSGRQFEKIPPGSSADHSFAEMEVLKSTYNRMVDEIHVLIEKVYEEEKIKRKAELNALQEQMKPHFLYNTIDAMGYLALSGKNEEVYDALEAFGNYYRILLSKGKEMISVGEETEMVKDYLELLKIRYGDSLRYVIDVNPEIQKLFMLKMVLQPLVENSINHGIRPKGTPGVVYVEGREENGYLRFIVEDDGIGIEEEQIRKLDLEVLDANEKSFGLRGTIERLKIFYEADIDFEITSLKGKGTTVTFWVPIRCEGEEGHD